MEKEKNASDELRETFSEVYHKIQSYCDWVMANCFVLDVIENKQERTDIIEGIPIMDLEMEL